jgi:hypothetical protein
LGWRRCLAWSLVVAAILAVGWASPAAAANRSAYAEAPMQVQTEGLTAEQQVRLQIELSVRLARELPPAALGEAIQVHLTPAEIAGVDKASRFVSPLKIGLVKALTPGIQVAGLDGESRVYPMPDGGFVWAAVVTAENAGAIRLHVQDLSLPDNAELYVYSRDGQAYGPYTGSGPNFSGDFWTTAVSAPRRFSSSGSPDRWATPT